MVSLTVKELRKLLEKFPEDYLVVISADDDINTIDNAYVSYVKNHNKFLYPINYLSEKNNRYLLAE